MYVLSTEEDEGVATMTISIADDDHKFDVWVPESSSDSADDRKGRGHEGDEALVEYQETLSWRGAIRVSEPDEDVFKALMVSDEMASLLNEWGVSGVRRATPTP